MSEEITLQPTGIYRENEEKGVQFFKIVGKDDGEKYYTMQFMCKSHYTETVTKAFGRLHPVLLQSKVESGNTVSTQGENV